MRGQIKSKIQIAILHAVQKRRGKLYNEMGAMSPQNGAKRHLLSGVHTILCLGHRSFLSSETRVARGSVSWNPREYW